MFDILTENAGEKDGLNNKHVLYLVGHGSLTPVALSGDPSP